MSRKIWSLVQCNALSGQITNHVVTLYDSANIYIYMYRFQTNDNQQAKGDPSCRASHKGFVLTQYATVKRTQELVAAKKAFSEDKTG